MCLHAAAGSESAVLWWFLLRLSPRPRSTKTCYPRGYTNVSNSPESEVLAVTQTFACPDVLQRYSEKAFCSSFPFRIETAKVTSFNYVYTFIFSSDSVVLINLKRRHHGEENTFSAWQCLVSSVVLVSSGVSTFLQRLDFHHLHLLWDHQLSVRFLPPRYADFCFSTLIRVAHRVTQRGYSYVSGFACCYGDNFSVFCVFEKRAIISSLARLMRFYENPLWGLFESVARISQDVELNVNAPWKTNRANFPWNDLYAAGTCEDEMPFKSIQYSSSEPSVFLHWTTLNRLLKLFVLLPAAAISYKMTFIFLECTHTRVHVPRARFWYHLFILSNDRIESDNALTDNNTLFNEMKFGQIETSSGIQQQGTTPFSRRSFVTGNRRAEGLALRGRFAVDENNVYEKCPAPAHPQAPQAIQPQHNRVLVLPPGEARARLYLSPVTDDLIGLRL